ncbi:MAG: PKD domain-containing protein [Planctomycetes bacterium]|nr:PKD domain-containing protein [Planctomycetota bacterium]
MTSGARLKQVLLLGLVLGLVGCKDLDIQTDGNKSEFRFASPVHLWVTFKGSAVGSEASVRWRSNRQGDLGTGPSITITHLQPGKHTIEVEVRQGGKKGTKKRTIKVVNDAPAVSILEPAANRKVGVGTALRLRGAATDTEDGVVPGEALTWSSSLDGALGGGPLLEVSHLRPGVHDLTLTARDRAGAEGRARVRLEVTNAPPTVTIAHPVNGQTVPAGARLRLRGSAHDPDARTQPQRVPGSKLEWRSDKDGRLGVGEDLTIDSLSPGAHTLELLATDEFGAVGKATVRIRVHNEAPTVRIREPGDGRSFSARAEVRFVAEAHDPEGGLDEGDIVWRSSRDGTIGKGRSVKTDRLSIGEHQVTCTATDRHGASGSARVRVVITNQAPTARITSPGGATTLLYTDTLSLEGRAEDREDGRLRGDRLEWTAVRVETGRSHGLGSGERLNVRVSSLVERLGFGRYEVRLVATDRDGAASPAATVGLTVQNRAPEVRIGNPLAGTTFTAGGVLLCSGYGQDPDRGRLLENAEMRWSARRVEDGAARDLGRGTRLEVRDLPAGTWDVTLTGIDPDDADLRTTATVRVRITEAAPVTTAGATPTSTTAGAPAGAPVSGLSGLVPGQ